MSAIQQTLLTYTTSGGGSSITFRSAGTAATGSGTITPGLPTGWQQNDILLFVAYVPGSAPTATPTGYTATNTGSVGGQLCIWYKIAGASETAQSITTTGAPDSSVIAQVYAYTGENTTTPINVQASGNTASLTTTSITTTVTNTVIVSIFGANNTAATWSAPANTTARATNNPTSSIGGILLVDETQTSAGATTARTASGPTGSPLSNFALALRT